MLLFLYMGACCISVDASLFMHIAHGGDSHFKAATNAGQNGRGIGRKI